MVEDKMANKNVGYLGWVGYGNLGDEANLLAFKHLFQKFEVKHLNSSLLNILLIKSRCSSVMLGGGTLVFNDPYYSDLKSFLDKKQLAIVFGTGVRNPEYWSTTNKECKSYDDWSACLNRCHYVGVRGPLSKQILNQHGVTNVEVIGDPVMYFADNAIERKKGTKILGLCFGTSYNKMWGDENAFFDFLARFMNIMIEKGWEIRLFSVWEKDNIFMENVAKKIGKNIPIFCGYKSLKETMSFMRNCDVFIGQKLHSVILACCTYTPSIMLEYRPKCLDFMASIGQEEFNMRTNSLSIDKLTAMAEQLQNQSEAVQSDLFNKVHPFKNILSEKAQYISKLIRNY
jgi:polysaccharide pyruvyl transferase WcaK-like protein